MKAYYKVGFNGYHIFDEDSKTIFKRHKFGDIVMGEFKSSRNIRLHGKFFMVIDLTFEHQNEFNDINDFREAVIVASGHWHWQKYFDGTSFRKADSISFVKMDDIEFGKVYSDVFNVCLQILGCQSEELENELLALEKIRKPNE